MPNTLASRMWHSVLRLWEIITRPSAHNSLGLLILGGFLGGVVFWGVQYGARVHQHRAILHNLSRDERQRISGVNAYGAFLEPLRCASNLPGLPCST